MVLRHFNLREQPFGVTPDPRYLYPTASHREALSSLVYGVWSGVGFAVLTAEPGMGKTTILFETLRKIRESSTIVLIFQTITSPTELLRALLIDLGVNEIPSSLVEMQAQLNQLLVKHSESGKRVVIAIDEAQNLDDSVLEAVRMLSNFETPREKLLQIVMTGQLQLAERLAAPQLLQLRQRISIFEHLDPLSKVDTANYVRHRLRVASIESNDSLFSTSALTLIAKYSGGIPRNINNICFNALSLGCALKRKTIDSDVIEEVVSDLGLKAASGSVVQRTQPIGEPKPYLTAQTRNSKAVPSRMRLYSRAAAVIAVCIATAGLAIPSYRNTLATTLNQNIYSNPSNVPVGAPAEDAKSTLTNDAQQRMVKATGGQSLYDVCRRSLGRCDQSTLRLILKANSWIEDPNHIEIGRTIVIPVNVKSFVQSPGNRSHALHNELAQEGDH